MPADRVHFSKWGLIASVLLASAGGVSLVPVLSAANQAEDEASAGGKGAGEQEVVIKREAVKLTDPKTYRVSMQLKAARELVLTAPVDGFVRTVSVKPQQKLATQTEAVRLDDRRSELLVKRARAGVQAAQLEKKIAQSKGDADQLALADARLEAVIADSELAQMELERLIVRAPFGGEIERVWVTEGQFVRAGEKLATLVDASKLVVEIPLERSVASAGGTVDIKIEEASVKAKIESVFPLGVQFDALRELTISPASAIVSIDNPAGRHSPGQTVYSELIPLSPVTLVPSIAIGNVPDGSRKVQVLRENVVRDLSVRIMGKVGTDNVFVSGRFNDGDEVIVTSTKSLADGTPLRALMAASGGAGRGAEPRGGNTAQPATGAPKKAVGF